MPIAAPPMIPKLTVGAFGVVAHLQESSSALQSYSPIAANGVLIVPDS